MGFRKWEIVAKLGKELNHNFLYDDLMIYKLKVNGTWFREFNRMQYPSYLVSKVNEFQIAIAIRKKEYLEGVN